MKQFVQRARNPWVLGIAAALAVYTLAGFLLIPYLVRHYVPKLAAEQLRCQAAIAEVRFNPFLFAFEAKDFSFKDAAGEAIFGFQRLFVDFELESLFRWAWTFADIRLEGWSADLMIDREGRLNLVKIAAALPESDEPSPPAENPPRLLLKHMALTGGSVKFTDRSKSTPVTETVSPIDLEFDAISTLPENRGSHVVSAKLANGGVVKWKGHVSFNPILSEGEVRLEGLKLATPWNFIRDQLDLAEPLGDVGATARYRFRFDQAKADLTLNNVGVKVAGLRLSTPAAPEPILVLDTIEVAGARFNLASRELTVPTFNVLKGRIAVSVDEKGIANWETLVKTGATTDAPQPTPPAARPSAGAPAAPPWRVKLEAFKVADIGITYADASHAQPSMVSVGAFKLGLGAEAEIGAAAPKARIRDLSVSLERIAIAERDKSDSLATLDSIKVEGGQMDLEKREATIQQVALQGGGAKIARDANQSIRWLELFGPRDSVRIDVTETENEEKANPWRFALKAVDLQGFRMALADQSVSPELAYDIEDMKVALTEISNDGQTPIAFDVQLKIKQGGALSTTGQLSQKADRAEAQVKVEGMNLTPLKSLVAQVAALTLESAAVSADMRVDYSQAKTGPSLKAAGAFSLDKLLLNESKSAKPFLSWKSLSADGFDFSLGPDKISIKEVRLVEPGTKIVIFKDKTINLATAFQRAPSSGQPATTEKQKSDPANPFPVTVERVRIERANVDFADLSLVLPFAARIHELSGAVTGISLAPSSRTRLKLEGRVDEYGQVNVVGSLSPLQLETFSDVKVVFRNVEMSPLSPYSGTFAGRRIQSGKLDLDLEYKVEDRRLKSNNTIILDQFTLGERVESQKAVNLPLDLAIALLTDGEGKINASVPIEGDVDHPEFSVGHLVWQAIVNLITTAVTAPFKALGALAGGEEGIDAILFRPGIDTIPPPEREKLAKVAEALTKRPMLALTVRGAYDPAADGEALRSMQVRRALARQLDVALQPGEDPGPVAVDKAETQRALEALSDERDGEDAIEEFEASYEKSQGKKPKRVSAILSLMGQASEDVDFYEKLFQHLVEKTPLATADLEALAVRRATAVVKELTSQAGFDPSRATAGEIEQVADTQADSVPTKLELGALERMEKPRH
ncbi:MAG: hypothetical protein USCGTAYLOR_00972 [Chromatiales bacterium USCg_Taylor]|nr:MAG: hypothetical protein USCGTAYLOR_00972 [Chromatiales bacterium USCg_Taylor]